MLARTIQVMVLSVVPWVELRLSIPYGITKGLPPVQVFAAAVVASWAMILPAFLVLDLGYERFLSRIPLVRRAVEEIRARGRGYIERWGVLGVGIYVSVPLPGPGIYSGALLAWLFGLPRRNAVIALACGVLVSGFLVTLISTGVITIIRKFL